MTTRSLLNTLTVVAGYTDGACKGNPGPGGWGVILHHPDTGASKELSGHLPATTNNRAELQAVIEALKALRKPVAITIHTDSQLIAQGWGEWLPKWQANGWRTTAKKAVANKDLWQQLVEAARPHKVTIIWVEGHAGHPLNERVDQLASQAAYHTPA